jgi:GAF domain-containing protein
MTTTQDATVTELQRTIAELREELAARTAELGRRNTEYSERIEHQAATIEVLRAMSASPGDTQPIFDLIARQAVRLCNVHQAAVGILDGTMVQLAASSGFDPAVAERIATTLFPRPLGSDFTLGRAIISGRPEQVEDITADSGHTFDRAFGAFSNVAVPMLRDGKALGAVTMGRWGAGRYSDSQVELLKTFAEQAVIAITSAETYRALQARTSELQESLEYQTATSDVLKVISRSAFDLTAVLQTVVTSAVNLCEAERAILYRYRDGACHFEVGYNNSPEYERLERANPIVAGPDTVVGRAMLNRQTAQINDALRDPEYGPKDEAEINEIRSVLGVPLMRDGELMGVFGLARSTVTPFSERQIELVTAFADQAVIAMENARLLSEQREALEQQTATAEVLQVINRSPGNLAPVFEAILEKAHTLCGSARGSLQLWDGEFLFGVATHGYTEEREAYLRQPRRPNPYEQRLIGGERLLHHADLLSTEQEDNPGLARDIAEATQARAALVVPLRKDGTFLGFINALRPEPRRFSDREIALLENFAAQAVIAMENARLLNEQREALEQQIATAEVLQVINASPGELAPVFQAILQKAKVLCEADMATFWTFDGERFFPGITSRDHPLDRGGPRISGGWQPGPHVSLGRVLAGEDTVHVADVSIDPGYQSDATARVRTAASGTRSALTVALRAEGRLLGAITTARKVVRPYSDKQIELLRSFAAQAVIAMENARLLNEQREALEQQTATADVLRTINASPGELVPVFSAILDWAHRVCDADGGVLYTFDGTHIRANAVHGYSPDYAAEMLARAPYPPPNAAVQQMIATRRFVQVEDAQTQYEGIYTHTRDLVESGMRTAAAIPLLKDDRLVGYITAWRREVRLFSDKQTELLENFAAQAVIAMENARLINETREALEQQTATAEVLQVINANPGNLVPVFETILEKAHSLCEVAVGSLSVYVDGLVHTAAMRGFSEEYQVLLSRPYPAIGAHQELMRGGPSRQTPDFRMVPVSPEMASSLDHLERMSLRTGLWVPLRKDGTALGCISLYRDKVQPFSEKEVALLENFGAQAVIAMENARLITETREALEQQTATAEVLQVINSSPGNLAPVFDAMLAKARKLCAADMGTFWYRDGPGFKVVASSALGDTGRTVIPAPGTSLDRIAHGADVIQIDDVTQEDGYRTGVWLERTQRVGTRTALAVPLRKDGTLVGAITTGRREVRRFNETQIGLLQSFAAQAVIAMENARLLDEIRRRQSELRVTFDNMGDGVVMFDAEHRLAASNRNFQELLDIPDAALAKRPSYADYLRLLAERGEFGVEDAEAELARRLGDTDRELRLERTRPDGRVIEVRRNPVPDGGFVLIYSDISERKRSEAEIRAARDAAEVAYTDLKAAQASLIQAEKMASLGQLTAGIAHEIKNPLNFVNNFATLSVDLLDELKQTAAPGLAMLDEARRAEVDDLASTLATNLDKINEHGRRADGIVRSMLEHSRGSSGERRLVDLNALVDEALNLAYHGARAQDQSFNIKLKRELGEGIAPITLAPQDITRVLLNLLSNGFYAARERQRIETTSSFEPTLTISTRELDDAVEIRVRDNGIGISPEIKDRLYQPFFTTKPTGEGTGLGLSLSYDIIVKQHGGQLTVDSRLNEFTEFRITLPRRLVANGGRA